MFLPTGFIFLEMEWELRTDTGEIMNGTIADGGEYFELAWDENGVNI